MTMRTPYQRAVTAQKQRWRIPIVYFGLCEVLSLFYELGLTGQTNAELGLLSAFLLIAITFPAVLVGDWAHAYAASLLGISSTNAIAYHSFWPRFIGVQASILVCTLAVVFVMCLINLRAYSNETCGVKNRSGLHDKHD